MFVWQAHEGAVTALAFGPGGQFLLSAGGDECVKAWEPFTGAEQFHISLLANNLVRIDFQILHPLRWLEMSHDGNLATVVQAGSGLVFLDLAREQMIESYLLPRVAALKRTPGGEAVVVLVSGVPSGMPVVHHYGFASRLGTVLEVTPFSTASRAMAFAPDGSRLAVGRSLHPWPPAVNGRVRHAYTKDYEPEDLAFSADNEHLFALVGGKVVVYSLPDGLFKAKLRGHCGQITAMQLSPDGRRLWTASRDATVKCWDTHSLTLDRTFRFDTGGLDCLAISPDGNVAAVGSGQKGTITVWDLG